MDISLTIVRAIVYLVILCVQCFRLRRKNKNLKNRLPAKKAQNACRTFLGGGGCHHSSWAFLAGKKKFDPEKSYETFYRENVPEKPLQTHHDKLTSIISDSSVTTMGIFP